MRISLISPFRKTAFLGSSTLVLLLVWALAWQAAVEHWLTRSSTLQAFQDAARVQPLNANYPQIIGTAYLTTDFSQAAEYLERSIQINPHSSQSWLNLAAAYAGMGETAKQHEATLRALAANPKDTAIQWQAANLFILNGDIVGALKLMREVTAAESGRVPGAIQMAYGASGGNIEATWQAIPATVDARLRLIRWLLEHQQNEAADRVWPLVISAQGKLTARDTFFYLESLLARREVAQAQTVWSGLAQTDPEVKKRIDPSNLVESGDFEDNLLNGGFCWRYSAVTGVIITMDTSTFHGGTRSLAIQFDADSVKDSGISQLIPVEPGTRYSLRAFLHAEELESANGVRIAVTDHYSNSDLLLTEESLGSFPWRESAGEFTTGPDTQLVRIGIVRSPAAGRVRGKIWLDDVRIEKR
jgi:tetratricopeptide (TPR) repeat protein